MKTKLLSLIITAFSFAGLSAQTFTDNGIKYNITDATAKTVEVIADVYNTAINVPASVTYNSEVYAVTAIGDNAFYNCIQIPSLTLPEGLLKIGSKAISGCSALTTLSIPSTVSSIDSEALTHTVNHLTSLTVATGNTAYKAIGNVLFTYDGTTLLAYANNSVTNYTVPAGVTAIGDYAFTYSDIESVILPEGVQSIGNRAFFWCGKLSSISFPTSLKSIGEFAFYYCDKLSSINLPVGLTEIKNNAFSYCSALTSILIPEGVSTIGADAFSYINNLTSVIIPSTVNEIGEYAFSDNPNLTQVTCKAVNPPTLGNDVVFGGNENRMTLIVPTGSAASYQNSNVWKEFSKTISNTDPVANAGYDQTIINGYPKPIILNGSLSYDPDADNLTFTWKSVEGIVLSDIHAVNPTFTTPTTDGSYHFQLVVNDGIANSAMDEVIVKVVSLKKMDVVEITNTENIIYAVTINGFDNSNPTALAYQYQYLFSPAMDNEQAVYDNLKTNLKTAYAALIPTSPAVSGNIRTLFTNTTMASKLDDNLKSTLDFSQSWDIVNNTTINLGQTVSVFEEEDLNGNGIIESVEIKPVTSQQDVDVYTVRKSFAPVLAGQNAYQEYMYINGVLCTKNYKNYLYDHLKVTYVTLNRYYKSTATALNHLSAKDCITLSPNPATDYFTVQEMEKETQLSVFDITGKKIMEKNISPNERISVIGWTKGTYLVKVNGKTAKLVVK